MDGKSVRDMIDLLFAVLLLECAEVGLAGPTRTALPGRRCM